MRKTKHKVEYTISLRLEAVGIIDKYREDKDRMMYHHGKALPVKANDGYNQFLKMIADHCNIDKKISMRCARYTCNMLLYEAGVSPEVRKHILGHTTVAMTDNYTFKRADVLQQAMDAIRLD